MRCPKCGSQDDKVIDSRSNGDGGQIRRRRECLGCATRFTTYEEIHRENLRIAKRNGQYEAFLLAVDVVAGKFAFPPRGFAADGELKAPRNEGVGLRQSET